MHRLIFNFHKWIFPVKLTAFASTPCSKKLGETFFFLKFYVKYASYGQHDDDDDDDDDDEFFCGMVDRRDGFSLISSRNHFQRFSPSQISNTPRAGFQLA